MMSRRTRAYLILAMLIILVVIVLILIFLAYRGLRNDQALPQPTPTTVENTTDTTTPTPTPLQEQEQAERIQNSSIQTVVKTFVERYGSFSNESNFQNLRDVMPLMTAGLIAETEQQIATTNLGEDFYGVSTRVVSMDIKQDAAGVTATATVQTQREETRGTGQNTSVKYQEIYLDLIQESGTWKVSSATWR